MELTEHEKKALAALVEFGGALIRATVIEKRAPAGDPEGGGTLTFVLRDNGDFTRAVERREIVRDLVDPNALRGLELKVREELGG